MVRTLDGVWREVAKALRAGARDRGAVARALYRPDVARSHVRRKVAGALRGMTARGFVTETASGRFALTPEGAESLEEGVSAPARLQTHNLGAEETVGRDSERRPG